MKFQIAAIAALFASALYLPVSSASSNRVISGGNTVGSSRPTTVRICTRSQVPCTKAQTDGGMTTCFGPESCTTYTD